MSFLEQLWLRRQHEERKVTLPYWKYVFSSGFGLVAAGAAFGAIHAYIMYLRYVERTGSMGVPLPIVAATALLPFLLWNPVRTFLIQADIVFLIPTEPKMNSYFRSPKARGAVVSSLAVLAVLSALWPFYSALGGTPATFVFIAIVTAGMKAALFYGAWIEKQFASRWIRSLFFIVKGTAAFASIHILFRYSLPVSAPATAVIWGAYWLSLKAPDKFVVHWEYLIEEERRMKAMIEGWFSQFVDLPRSEETYRRRPLVERLLTRLSGGNADAYTYLYWRTLFRSSIFMIVMRLILVAYFFMYLFPGQWTAGGIFFVFLFLIGIQLKSLQQVRRDVLHLAVSPIPEERRQHAVLSVRRRAHLFCALLLAVPLFWMAPFHVAVVLAGFGAGLPWIFARRRREK